jgi:uncharacterized protein YndB with AHSA1/START domain
MHLLLAANGTSMRERRIENEIQITRPAAEVFDYVTQPCRWHEWHPASEGATADLGQLQVGKTFDEIVSMKPFGLLPIRLRRQLHWTVTAARPQHSVTLEGKSKTIDVRVQYALEGGELTRFHRTFHYRVKGWLGIFDALFVLPRMRAQSATALANLKRRLESDR